jgi:hypothetical protein
VGAGGAFRRVARGGTVQVVTGRLACELVRQPGRCVRGRAGGGRSSSTDVTRPMQAQGGDGQGQGVWGQGHRRRGRGSRAGRPCTYVCVHAHGRWGPTAAPARNGVYMLYNSVQAKLYKSYIPPSPLILLQRAPHLSAALAAAAACRSVLSRRSTPESSKSCARSRAQEASVSRCRRCSSRYWVSLRGARGAATHCSDVPGRCAGDGWQTLTWGLGGGGTSRPRQVPRPAAGSSAPPPDKRADPPLGMAKA